MNEEERQADFTGYQTAPTVYDSVQTKGPG